MRQEDTALMLWALAHGWTVRPSSGSSHGFLWRDPAGRRFLASAADAAGDLPSLSDELRTRILDARARAEPAPPSAAAPRPGLAAHA
ncbi:MAG TPA: hypothetical protein VFQ45_06775 [Longimicrobium sp.]|nr:hypothetical protein [Longimicrobium sp.]